MFDAETHILVLCQVVSAGATHLVQLANREDGVLYADWASAVKNDLRGTDFVVTDRLLMWAWESLRSEATIERQVGSLPAAGACWKDKNERFRVLHDGAMLLIGLKPANVEMLRQSTKKNPMEEDLVVTLEAPLYMKPGKASRLECCDATANVRIRVTEAYSAEREADIARVPQDQISISKDVVTVQVESLNQAYTVASRRLEPERRSHGGRAYDHMLYVQGRHRYTLEEIRQKVESGTWDVPEAK